MARLQIQEKLIGEHRYRFEPLPSEDALEIFAKLCNLLGPAAKGLGSLQSVLDVEVGESLAELLGKVSAADLRLLISTFSRSCNVQISLQQSNGATLPTWVPLDANHFRGLFGEQLAWLVEAVRYNFAGPLGGYLTGLSARVGGAQKESS